MAVSADFLFVVAAQCMFSSTRPVPRCDGKCTLVENLPRKIQREKASGSLCHLNVKNTVSPYDPAGFSPDSEKRSDISLFCRYAQFAGSTTLWHQMPNQPKNGSTNCRAVYRVETRCSCHLHDLSNIVTAPPREGFTALLCTLEAAGETWTGQWLFLDRARPSKGFSYCCLCFGI